MYGYNNQFINQQYPQQIRTNQQQIEQLYNNYMPNMNMYGNNMMQQNVTQQTLKGRPVSSYDEAKASMIDLDGSLFVFTDISNKKIYTKQIMLDGSAEFKTYVLEEQKQNIKPIEQEYVLRSDFERIIKEFEKQIQMLKGGIAYDEKHDEPNDEK